MNLPSPSSADLSAGALTAAFGSGSLTPLQVLQDVRERIDALGGSLRIDRAARGGVRIEAAFPA